jgi:single-strand DNA-binding protein
MSVQVSFVGNLSKDVDLSFTNGVARAAFTVVVNKRVKDGDTWKDGPPSFFHCTAWRQLAENLVESVGKGQRVMVIGQMAQREYQTKEGEKRSVWDVTVDEVGPSLRYAQASVRKVERAQQAPETDLWATDAPF